MRKLAAVWTLWIGVTPAFAGQSEDALTWEQLLRVCALEAETAGLVMEMRQLGAKMADQMESWKDNARVAKVVMNAYSQPRFSSEEVRKQAIRDFENDYYRGCLLEAEQILK